MSFELYPLFPSVVYKEKLAIEFSASELDYLRSANTFLQALGNNLSQDMFLLDHPRLINVKNTCLKHAQYYFTNIMKYKYDLRLTNSWLNITQLNQEHALHNHTNSIVSGVLYIKVSDSSPSISFNRLTPQFLLNLKAEEYNFFNSMEWEVPVEDNTIIIFPSQCFHHVKKNLTSNDRISIAFNTFINGNVCTDVPGSDLDLG